MTPSEINEEKRNARDLARRIGGLMAMLLGVTPTVTAIRWDPRKARFIIDGRYVSADAVRLQLLRIETGTGRRMAAVTDKLTSRRITLEQWKTEIKQIVGSSHVVAAALGLGSISAAVNSDLVQGRISGERKFVDGFAGDIEKKKLRPPTIKARAKSYMLAASVTFAVVVHTIHKVTGYTEARRITTARESCQGCRDYSYEWMEIGAIPPIGSLQCGSRCRCYLEYR